MAGFIAAGYMVEKGHENKAIDMAQKLAIDDIDAALVGAKGATPKENDNGSYERFMRAMGQLNKQGKLK